MQTMNVREAAAFLGVHTDTVRDGAKAGKIPGAKVGRAWVFIEEDLAQYLRSLYGKAQDREGTRWGSTAEKAPPSGGTSFASTARAYEKALALPTARKLSRLRHDP